MKRLIVMICVVLIAGYAGAQTKTAIKAADLKKEITNHLAKNYAGYKVAGAYKVETNKVITYEVVAQKETTKTTLIYNDKGGFVKAEANKPEQAKPKLVKKAGPEQKVVPIAKPEEKTTTTPPKN